MLMKPQKKTRKKAHSAGKRTLCHKAEKSFVDVSGAAYCKSNSKSKKEKGEDDGSPKPVTPKKKAKGDDECDL